MKKNRPTIGLLYDSLTEDYNYMIWEGVTRASVEYDVNLLCFAGGSLENPQTLLALKNQIYELVSTSNIDGMVAISGSVGNNISLEKLVGFYEKYRSIPLVSVGVDLPGHPSIIVDCYRGMYEMVVHFIINHGYNKIAFIRGPENNFDADERFRAYQEALKDYGIPILPELVAPGGFDRFDGTNAVKILLDERNVKPDAIIAANDNMALYAMLELQRRGIATPGEIAIAGFDDIKENFSIKPSMTTVRQPLYEMGYESVRMITELIESKEKHVEPLKLKAKLMVRRSCGCDLSTASLQKENLFEKINALDIQSGKFRFVQFLPEIAILIDYEYPQIKTRIKVTDWSRLLLESLYSEVLEKQDGEFHQKLEKYISLAFDNGIEVSLWYEIVTQLFEFMKDRVVDDAHMENLQALWRKTLIFIAIIAEGNQAYQYETAREFEIILQKITSDLIGTFNKRQLASVIQKSFPRLGVQSCYIALYQDETRKTARLFQYFASDQPKEIDNLRCNFPSEELVPYTIQLFPERKSYIVMALYFRDDYLGYSLWELGGIDGMYCETLAFEISSVIAGSELLSKVRRNALDLRKQVEVRTRELSEERNKLKSRNELIEQELEMARRIQDQLLPHISPRKDLAFFIKPLDKIGGDFYDFIAFRDSQKIGIFLSDVSGHGVPAAFITSMIKTVLLQSGSEIDKPSRLLIKLNKSLVQQTGGNFVTAFYGIFDPLTREFQFSNAGHNLPFVVSNQNITQLQSLYTSLPLAILDSEDLFRMEKDYRNEKIILEQGSKLLLYTDGLVECINIERSKASPAEVDNNENDFGVDRLRDVLLQNAGLPAQKLIEEIYSELVAYRGSETFDDDVCMVCLDVEN